MYYLQILARCCPNLKKLALRGCELIGDDGLEAVAYYCRGLTQLNIQDTPVTLRGYRAVKKYCKRCVIEHTNPGFCWRDQIDNAFEVNSQSLSHCKNCDLFLEPMACLHVWFSVAKELLLIRIIYAGFDPFVFAVYVKRVLIQITSAVFDPLTFCCLCSRRKVFVMRMSFMYALIYDYTLILRRCVKGILVSITIYCIYITNFVFNH